MKDLSVNTSEQCDICDDQEKRLEYTARQKALYDYNTLMEESYNRGYLMGEEKGMKQIVEKMRRSGMNDEQIRKILNA